jgi:hypothetical protein
MSLLFVTVILAGYRRDGAAGLTDVGGAVAVESGPARTPFWMPEQWAVDDNPAQQLTVPQCGLARLTRARCADSFLYIASRRCGVEGVPGTVAGCSATGALRNSGT